MSDRFDVANVQTLPFKARRSRASKRRVPAHRLFDVIVIGSGPAGTHVSKPMVDAGLNVLMIDGGIKSEIKLEEDFKDSFEDIRKFNKNQHKLFFGDDFSGMPVSSEKSHANSMTSGTRSYISRYTEELLPIATKDVEISQSLAKGGLSETWGAACGLFNQNELMAMGIKSDLKKEYQEVIDEIGISGIFEEYKLQKPLEIDQNAKSIFARSARNNDILKKGFFFSLPLLAVLSEKKGKREATRYDDLEYWLNRGNSIYRARLDIEELEKKKNFRYMPGHVIKKFQTKGEKIILDAFRLKDRREVKISFKAKIIVFAAGSLNTCRIMLSSFDLLDLETSFITKRHFLIPCLNPYFIGKAGSKKRYSFCQLFIYDKNKNREFDRSFTQIYTYKSLMLYKLRDYSPLSSPESLNFLSMFSPAMVIADVRFPSFLENNSKIRLKKENKKEVIEFVTKTENKSYKEELNQIKRILRYAGLIPIKVVDTPFGSTAHYAGGVPFCEKPLDTLSTSPIGQLHQNPRVFVADASSWRALPAKPPALTIMANAKRIGKEIVRTLKSKKKVL